MAGKKGKKSRGIGSLLFSISARSAMLMNGSLLILSYLSMYVNPAKAWFMTVFGILFFPLFIINFLLLLWAFARRSRAAVIPILALLPSLLLIDRYIRFTDKQTLSQPSDLKIVSYNVGMPMSLQLPMLTIRHQLNLSLRQRFPRERLHGDAPYADISMRAKSFRQTTSVRSASIRLLILKR